MRYFAPDFSAELGDEFLRSVAPTLAAWKLHDPELLPRLAFEFASTRCRDFDEAVRERIAAVARDYPSADAPDPGIYASAGSVVRASERIDLACELVAWHCRWVLS